jgi:hypothetical protein
MAMLKHAARVCSQLASACALLTLAATASAESVCIDFFPGGCTASGPGEQATGSAEFGPLFGQFTVTVDFEQGEQGGDIGAQAEVFSGSERIAVVVDLADDDTPVSQTFTVGNGVYVIVSVLSVDE